MMKLSEAIEFTKQKLAEGHKSDGCTFAPDFWIKDCCHVHDMLIRFRPVGAFHADWIYFLLMVRRGFPLAPVYYAAVTVRSLAAEIWTS